MHPRTILFLSIPVLCLFACVPEPEHPADEGGDALTAATLGRQTVRPTSEYLAEGRYADASIALGKRLASQCKACHTLHAGGPHMLGPNLHGVFGRRAGRVDDFDYSDALGTADFAWTPRALDAWLARPDRFLPGNRMVFAGIPHAADRDAVIAVLLEETAAVQ